MYYKVTDTNSDLFKRISALREKEIQREKDNLERIKSIVGFEFEGRFGHFTQTSMNRTQDYWGFEFKQPEKLDPKVWKENKEHPSIYEAYAKTKVGREMRDSIRSAFQTGWYTDAFEALNIDDPIEEELYDGKLFVPYLEASKDVAVIILNERYDLLDDAAIPIKKNEFNELNTEIRKYLNK